MHFYRKKNSMLPFLRKSRTHIAYNLGRVTDKAFSILVCLQQLYFYLHTPPKCDIILDLLSSILWRRIVPGSIFVLFPIDLYRIVARFAFPRAGRMRVAFLKILAHYRIGREVLIPFHDYTVIAFSQFNTIPDCLGHGMTLILSCLTCMHIGGQSSWHVIVVLALTKHAVITIMQNKCKPVYIPTVAQKYILIDQSGRLSCYPHKRSMLSGGSAECSVTDLIQPLTYIFPEEIRRPRGDVGGNRSASPEPLYDSELRPFSCMVGWDDGAEGSSLSVARDCLRKATPKSAILIAAA